MEISVRWISSNFHWINSRWFQLKLLKIRMFCDLRNWIERFFYRIGEHCSGRIVHPGSVQTIVQHPLNDDKILIAYKNAVIVHWDLPSNSHDRTYVYKQVCCLFLVFLSTMSHFLFLHSRKLNRLVGIIKAW